MNGQESQWIRVAPCGSIPPREGRAATIGDRQIAIFNLGDRFVAVDNQCPHQSGPLCDGIVAGDAVVCPLHAWKVNLETGAVARPVNQQECIRTYATRVDAGVVSIEISSGAH
jgi:nitrite reductase (NADH) small subunit